MYEVYYYPPNKSYYTCYNIRNCIDNSTTGCCPSLPETLTADWTINNELLSVEQFEQVYHCILLFTTDSLSDLRDTHPEYFV